MAGTSAMNGEPIKATMPMRTMALRQPGSAAAIRAPSAMRRRIFPPSPTPGLDGGEPHDRQRRHHGTERHRVHGEDPCRRAGEEHHAGQGGPDDTTHVELRRRQRHRPQQVVGGHQVGDHGLVGREAHRRGHTTEEGDHHQRPRRCMAGGGEHRQQGREACLGQRGDDEPPTAVQPVGEHPAHRGEHADGDEGGGRDRPGPQRVVGSGGDHHPQRHGLHPRADVGHQRRAPHQGEVLGAQRPQRGQHGATRLLPGRCGPTGSEGRRRRRPWRRETHRMASGVGDGGMRDACLPRPRRYRPRRHRPRRARVGTPPVGPEQAHRGAHRRGHLDGLGHSGLPRPQRGVDQEPRRREDGHAAGLHDRPRRAAPVVAQPAGVTDVGGETQRGTPRARRPRTPRHPAHPGDSERRRSPPRRGQRPRSRGGDPRHHAGGGVHVVRHAQRHVRRARPGARRGG